MKRMLTALAVVLSAAMTQTVSAGDTALQPVLHYRADTGVSLDGNNKVTGWKNIGTLGSAGDVAVSGVSDITMAAAEAGKLPSLVFGGTSCLRTAEAINLGTTAADGCSWFVSMKVKTIKSNQGVLGMGDASARFGAFAPDSSSYKCFVNSDGNSFVIRYKRDGWFVLGASGWGTSASAYDGWYAQATPSCKNSFAAVFAIGNLGEYDWCSSFIGEIAEVRCYSRALSPSERTAVQMEMGVAVGQSKSVTQFKNMDLFEAEECAYNADGSGFGNYSTIGPDTGSAVAISGGLTVSYGDELDKSLNTTAYLAHNGASGDGRVWCMAPDGASSQSSYSLCLSLDAESSAALPTKYSLMYRSSTSAKWTVLKNGTKSATGCVSLLLDSWSAGYYCFVGNPKPVLHYRADTGVTLDGNNKVTGWKNIGLLGSAGDVAVSGASDIAMTAAEAGKLPSLVFGGASCLRTAEAVNLGTTAADGCSWFVSMKVKTMKSNQGVLGMGDLSTRFGAFTADASTYRCFANSEGGSFVTRYKRDGWFVLGASGWGTSASAYDGWYAQATPSCKNSFEAVFAIGNLGEYTWCSPFIGEIAEIRCYSRALTPSERVAVQMEMGIAVGQSSKDTTNFTEIELFEADGCAYKCDGVAFGCPVYSGVTLGPTETPVVKGTSGGLSVSFTDAIGDGNNTVVYMANNGESISNRVWCLAANGNGGNAHPIEIALSGVSAKRDYKLLFKGKSSDKWTTISGRQSSKGEDSVVFEVAKGWQNGYYQVCELKRGLFIVVK